MATFDWTLSAVETSLESDGSVSTGPRGMPVSCIGSEKSPTPWTKQPTKFSLFSFKRTGCQARFDRKATPAEVTFAAFVAQQIGAADAREAARRCYHSPGIAERRSEVLLEFVQ